MKVAFLFAGQGSQYVQMGKDVYEKYDEAKEIYDSINLDFSLKELCFEGPSEKLNDTSFAQSAILATSLAIANVLKKANINPDYVAGLSLGEYSALCYSEVMSVNDACRIVRERGKIMANALPLGTTTMAAVLNAKEEDILKVCSEVKKEGVCEIANYNCPGQIVITGEKNAVSLASEKLISSGAKVVPLNVSGAFHSSLLENASDKLRKVLMQYELKGPKIPVVYNVSGKEESGDIIDILANQIKSTVYFMQSISYMIDKGVDTFIEIGPGTTLKSFVRKIDKESTVYSANNVKDIEEILEVFKKWKKR